MKKAIKEFYKKNKVTRFFKVIVVFIGVCLILFAFLCFKFRNRGKEVADKFPQEHEWKVPEKEGLTRGNIEPELDMNGDGELEKLVVYTSEPGNEINGYIALFNRDGEEIARTLNMEGSPPPLSNAEVYTLNFNSPKEYLRADVIIGPHQAEAMFFGLEDNNIYSISKTADFKDAADFIFYIESHDFIVEDLDHNGFMEVCEVVKEYSPGVSLAEEEEKAIEEIWVDDTEMAKKIAEYSKASRARPAIWSIYSFNGKYFEEQTGSAYDKYFDFLVNDGFAYLKKADLTKEDIKQVETIRNFWSP